MSKYTFYTVFEVQSSERLQNLSYLLEFTKTAISLEYALSSGIRKEEEFNPKLAIEIVTRRRNQAIENHKIIDSLGFKKKELLLSLDFDIINWNLFLITVSSACFSYDQKERLQTIRDLVMFCEIAYKAFAPDYGYGLTNPEYTLIDPENLKLLPDTIFDLNFFGPKLVEKIGKEKLLICPTWRTVEFSDGGMLLELSDDPIERPQEYQGNYIKTADILGLTKT